MSFFGIKQPQLYIREICHLTALVSWVLWPSGAPVRDQHHTASRASTSMPQHLSQTWLVGLCIKLLAPAVTRNGSSQAPLANYQNTGLSKIFLLHFLFWFSEEKKKRLFFFQVKIMRVSRQKSVSFCLADSGISQSGWKTTVCWPDISLDPIRNTFQF